MFQYNKRNVNIQVMRRRYAAVMHVSVSQFGLDVSQLLGVAFQYLPLFGQCHIDILHLRYMHHGSEIEIFEL